MPDHEDLLLERLYRSPCRVVAGIPPVPHEYMLLMTEIQDLGL